MNTRRCLSVFVLLAVFFAYTTMDLQAAALLAPDGPHAVTYQEMHRAVQASNEQVIAARKSVQDFFSRPGIASQIRRAGIDPESISSTTAMLSDLEIQRLNQQIMAMDAQKETLGGLTKGGKIMTVIGLICVGAGVAMIVAGSEEDRIGDSDWAINWKATGIIWAAVGGALTIVGLTRRQ